MTAPTVDTPLTTDIERVDAFIDKRCTGGTPECPCPHGSWDRITAALLAARREVECVKIDRAVTRPFPWRAVVNGPDDAQIVCGEHGNPSTFATIAECHTEADARFIVEVCNAAALAATPEEK